MTRFFNTAGPVNPNKHYCLLPLSRIELPDILTLLEQEKYFVLHAPRQTGKTSVLQVLQARLNAEGRYHCIYANVEVAQGYRENVAPALTVIMREIAEQAERLGDKRATPIVQEVLRESTEAVSISIFLTRWAQATPKPIVLLLDEIDTLVGDTLISVLRQLRAGYPNRPQAFPSSVILCGVRDPSTCSGQVVRDYRLTAPDGKSVITGGSAFNIKAESLRLGDFARTEVEQLYAQHTAETGQIFTSEAIERAWYLTQGQPWLVNALAYEACFKMREGRDRSMSITEMMIE